MCTGSTVGWVDIMGDGCDWYMAHELPGCPDYGNALELDGGMGVADDNCCFCAGSDVSAIARLIPYLIHSKAVFVSIRLCIIQPTSPPVQSLTDGTTAPLPTDSPTAVIVVSPTSSPITTTSTSPPTTVTTDPTPSPTAFAPATLTCPNTLDQSMEIDSSATLYYAVVPSQPAGSGNGLLCGRLQAENDGWIGIGFSANGSMAGSQAIIGIPSAGTVLKYDLTITATPLSENGQTLSGTSIAEVDGMVVIEFTKLLVEEGEVPILEGAENTFIYAAGRDELGYHFFRRSSFVVAL